MKNFISAAFTNLECFLSRTEDGVEEKAHKKGRYEFIPLNVDHFIRLVSAAKKISQLVNPKAWKGDCAWERTCKFLEVGCGIGAKLLIARQLFDAYGLEVQKSYVDKARMVNGKGNENLIIRKDALKFNDYGDYDIIYFWCPFRDHEKEVELERRIYEQASENTVIIGIGALHGKGSRYVPVKGNELLDGVHDFNTIKVKSKTINRLEINKIIDKFKAQY